MATNQSVPKSELFMLLRTVFSQKKSGMISLVTDSKKSVLMRFSQGEITSARCRSWDIENTIEALLETDNVKYSFIPSSSEDKPPLLAADDFMLMIDPSGEDLEESASVMSDTESDAQAKSEKAVDDEAKKKQQDKEQSDRDIDRAIAAKMNYF